MILAGGYGTRLRSAWTGPKCLVPVLGRPMIGWILAQLEAYGVRHAILAVAYQASRVRAWVDRWAVGRRVTVSYYEEAAPSGVWPAVRAAARQSDADTILVMNSDTYVAGDLRQMIDAHEERVGRQVTAFFDRTTGRHVGVTCLDWLSAVRLEKDPIPAARYVEGDYPFIDAGTPEGLALAHDFIQRHAVVA